MRLLSTRLKWILGITFFLGIAGVIAVYAILSSYEFEDFRPQFIKTVKEATGRDLTLSGKMALDISLQPALVLEDVSLENAPWGTRPQMMSVKRLQLQVALIPLLSQQILVKRLVLMEPDLLIETNPQGESNLVMNGGGSPSGDKKEPPKSDTPFPLFMPVVKELQVQKGNLTIRDGVTKETYAVRIDDMVVRSRPDRLLDVAFEGAYNADRSSMKGTLGTLASAADPTAPWPVDLTARLGDTSATIKGTITEPLEGKGIDLEINGNGRSIPTLLALFGIHKVAEMGPFRVAGHLTDPDGKLKGQRLNIQVGATGKAQVEVTGSVDDFLSLEGIDVSVAGRGPSIPDLLGLFGITEMPDPGPFQVTGHFSSKAGKYTARKLQVEIGSDGAAAFTVTGTIGDVVTFTDVDLHVKGEGPSIQKALQIFDISEVPEVGPFQATGRIIKPEKVIALKNVDVTVGTETTAQVHITGAIKDLTGLQGGNADFSIVGDDFSRLEKIFHGPLFANGPFRVSGQALIPLQNHYQFPNLQIVMGQSNLSGSADMTFMSQKKPRLEAHLSSTFLDMRPFFPESKGKGPVPAKAVPLKKGDRVFSTAPLPLAFTRHVEGDVHIQAKRVLLPFLFMDNLTARLLLDDGNLSVSPFKVLTGDGSINGRLQIRPSKSTFSMETDITADRFDVGEMLKKLNKEDLLEGNLDMDIHVRSQGDTIAGFMAGLNGKAAVVLKQGRVKDQFLTLVGGDLTATLVKLVKQPKDEDKFTDIRCLVSALDIHDGLAETQALLLDTSQVTLAGHGKVDLTTEAIDVAIKPSPKKGIGIKGVGKLSLSIGELTKPLKMGGTLAKPTLTVDPKGTLVTIGKAVGGAALFGPVGLAAALATGEWGDKDPCETAMEAVENLMAEPQPEEPQPEASRAKDNILKLLLKKNNTP